MSASLKEAVLYAKNVVERHPTSLTVLFSCGSFYAGWQGHKQHQKHQKEIESMIIKIQERVRQIQKERKAGEGSLIFSRTSQEWNWLMNVTTPAVILTLAASAYFGYKAGVPVGTAAARAAIPSTLKELERIRQRTRASKHVKRIKRRNKMLEYLVSVCASPFALTSCCS
mmetsp:Transcript_3468/g.10498  ORF Transcript_3468/g.10498 Transcript_3468/m.10498 type:complete len:170 (+) Transcript_3468:99-608(+)